MLEGMRVLRKCRELREACRAHLWKSATREQTYLAEYCLGCCPLPCLMSSMYLLKPSGPAQGRRVMMIYCCLAGLTRAGTKMHPTPVS